MENNIESSDLSRQIKSGIVLFLLCLVFVFALHNSEHVSLNFILWEMTLPRVLVFFVLFMVGFLCGIAISNWRRLTHKNVS